MIALTDNFEDYNLSQTLTKNLVFLFSTATGREVSIDGPGHAL